VLSSLQLTAQFPATIVENFYVKSRNAIEDGRTKAPFGFVIPVQRDMTRVAELLRILRIQGIEIGQATAEFRLGEATYPAGSYVIKRDQPYGRLAKNLLEKQVFPDTRLTTYDDSGWTMGLLMAVDVKEIADAAVLKVPTTPVTTVVARGKISGSGSAGLAVAHHGSNNMIVFRYRLRSAGMRIAEKSFAAEGVEFPAGSFVIAGPPTAAAREAVEQLGLTAAALSAVPTVSMHDAPAPRIAIYSQWTGTQDLGWYRLTFDNFGIPYDLIYKERVVKGDLRSQYDVILMATQNINRQAVLQAPSARPQPYQKSEKYKSLGMYGETPDMSGGFGQAGVDAFAKFLEGGGTLIAAGAAVRFPIEFGWARTVDAEPITGVTAQRPVVQGDLVRPEHPAFYGYTEKTVPIKYVGGVTLRVGVADQANLLARYVGGDSSVLTGSMVGADQLRQKAFAVDLPAAHHGKGRVMLFTNNPVYRWQNHGEFNMVFNSLLNWSYVPTAAPGK
jgi:8-oxo-dGTP pyrophosphatase MutT (NUDIX family)